MRLDELKKLWHGGLIVSCQAPADSPLARPEIIAAMALAAERGGAIGVRIDGATNICAVRRETRLPVLGIEKSVSDESEVYITPTLDAARRVSASGAVAVALDATLRLRPAGEKLADIIRHVHDETSLIVVADVATADEGVRAVEEGGADMVSTTLAGYTAETRGHLAADAPDLELVETLAKRLDVPVICEGRLRSPADVRQAFECGAFTVVVGTAITGVDWLVRHFNEATVAARAQA